MDKKQTVIEFLERQHIPYRWVDHPAVFTVAESAGLIEDKTPIKNLLLRSRGGQTFLIIMAGNERLDLKTTAVTLGVKKLHFADSNTMMSSVGVLPGSVSLFGILHPGSKDIEVILDAKLMTGKELGFHPNDNTATLFITPADVEQILRHTGHHYKVINLY